MLTQNSLAKVPNGVNHFWLALKKFRERDFKACVELCTSLLEKTPNDQAVWLLKCRALSVEAYIDESEIDDEGIGDLILDENAISSLPRPGTSIQTPSTASFSSCVFELYISYVANNTVFNISILLFTS